ncbi:PREDICTED: uncharacterized protein LOC108363533 isoform X2 [Rhagoletis zephyria]|uniref:uncharacterized protein LOC108363533 isoform X1 n=1 Tax=Rhagoletis zephyria TaxID=28612 RepID=UPI0008119E91|nr:PREDICTED: uncharacterized protein LOC108363533 isoform X1 [Rhagoletis zephyria]XP_017472408.1 PREDICTED: uncharacterized protein LOC108363533 isoform X2 [Rhagoletis zephyria]
MTVGGVLWVKVFSTCYMMLTFRKEDKAPQCIVSHLFEGLWFSSLSHQIRYRIAPAVSHLFEVTFIRIRDILEVLQSPCSAHELHGKNRFSFATTLQTLQTVQSVHGARSLQDFENTAIVMCILSTPLNTGPSFLSQS